MEIRIRSDVRALIAGETTGRPRALVSYALLSGRCGRWIRPIRIRPIDRPVAAVAGPPALAETTDLIAPDGRPEKSAMFEYAIRQLLLHPHDTHWLQNLLTSMTIVEGAFSDRGGSDKTFTQLAGLKILVDSQADEASGCSAQWAQIKVILDAGIPQVDARNTPWTALTAPQRDVLARMFVAMRKQIQAAFGILGMGSAHAAPDFDAPVYYAELLAPRIYMAVRTRHCYCYRRTAMGDHTCLADLM
jgi:hypothetical protein